MDVKHSLLRRQLKRLLQGGEPLPKDAVEFIQAVDEAYQEFDTDREMLERALELSSQELLQANAEMRAIFQAIPDMLFRINGDGLILDFKAGRTDDFVLEPERSLVGKRIQGIPVKDVGRRFKEAIREIKERGSTVTIEYSLTIQGKRNHYEARMVPLMEGQFVVIVRNITARKEAEEALTESEEKYRLLVENAKEAIFISQDGFIKFPNRNTMVLFGRSEEELSRGPWIEFVHPDDRQGMKDFLQSDPLNSNSMVPRSCRLISGDGNEFYAEISVIPTEWHGRPAEISFVHDVTEKRRLEHQLLQAQKLEAIGTLAGGIAHDFNNLLMGVQGYASLMLIKTKSGHPNYERLKSIESLVESGANLTRQLLGFARGGTYQLKATDLNGLINKTTAIFERTKKEIRVRKKFHDTLWTVEVDQGQIEQVLLNLFVNSWQAMPGGGDLFVETENVTLSEQFVNPYDAMPGRYVKISITDTGVGMEEKTLERIFEPFFTTKEMGRGAGLGLASAYGIIRKHFGIIQVHSTKGFGTTFTIYLPASSKAAPKLTASSQELLGGKETILLVDDEETILAVTREMLNGLGYDVLVSNSGPDALRLFRANKGGIDLVVLDMIMPGIGGAEVFKDLRLINPDIKVVLSSGYSINDQISELLGEKETFFIQKPFTISDLSRVIRRVLTHHEN
jgi:two-component system cell cycle sensor histidine kinase/response regulator CckA